jgi:YVTN family beta-propeller protein
MHKRTQYLKKWVDEQGWARVTFVLLLLAVTPVAFAILGDVDEDNDVDSVDVQHIIESVVETRILSIEQRANADVDSDGDVDIADAQILQQFVDGTVANLPPRFAYNSSSIAQRRDGSLVGVANPDNDSVTFLDPTTDTVLVEVAVGGEPIGVAFSRDGLKAYVTNAQDRTVSVIDTVAFTVTNEIAVGVEPFGIVINHRGDSAYVSNMMSATVSVIDLATETVVNTVPVGEKPQGLAVSEDSLSVYVTHLNGGQVTHIDTVSLATTVIPLAESPFDELNLTNPAGLPNRMKGLAIHPVTGEVWLPHQLANANNTVAQVFNSTIFPALSIIDPATHTEVFANRMTLFSGFATPVGSPEAMAFSPDGSLAYVVSAASNDLTIINTTIRQEVGLIRDIGDNPRGIVVSPDGAKAYIFNRLSPKVTVIDLLGETVVASVVTAPNLMPPTLDVGRRILFTSALPETAGERFFGCEACHFDGRDDGLTWFFFNGPRQTMSMAGSNDFVGLMHHSGDRENLQAFAAAFTSLQGGTGVTPDQSGFSTTPT